MNREYVQVLNNKTKNRFKMSNIQLNVRCYYYTFNRKSLNLKWHIWIPLDNIFCSLELVISDGICLPFEEKKERKKIHFFCLRRLVEAKKEFFFALIASVLSAWSDRYDLQLSNLQRQEWNQVRRKKERKKMTKHNWIEMTKIITLLAKNRKRIF